MTNEQEKARELAKLLNAFADGKQLQVKSGRVWYDYSLNAMDIFIKNFYDTMYEFRIKPETKRIALNQQDLIDRASSGKTMWVKKHVTSSLITCIRPDKVYVGERGIDYGMLRVEYNFLDGSPCYKEVECEL